MRLVWGVECWEERVVYDMILVADAGLIGVER